MATLTQAMKQGSAKDLRRKRTARELRPSEEWVSLPGATPPIISEELFVAAQHQLRQNAVNSPRNRKHEYLLSGRIKCGCGWSMRGLTVAPRYVYYRCRRCDKEFGPDRCRAKSVKAREVESLVWDEAKKALSSPEAILAAVQMRQEALDPERLETELEAPKREVDRLKKQERNLICLYRVGEYDEQLLEIETRTLKEAQARAEGRYEELKHRLVAMSQVAEQMESIETYCEWASQNLENLNFDQKRFVLEALDVQIIVDGKKVMIRGFLPVGTPSFFPASFTPRHRPGLGFAPE
jgi:site-specific DNA recombinase